MTRVVVTGGAGLLGGHLLRQAPPGVQAHATWRHTPIPVPCAHRVDLAEREDVLRLIDEIRPDVVVHTAYDKAHGKRDILDASRNVALACAHSGATLVHLSSDVVFAGERAPYAEDSPLDPVHEYGRWKAASEQAVTAALPDAAIVRTSLIVCTDPVDHTSRWLAETLDRGEPPRLFTDELRCPIAAPDLAAALWALTDLPRRERTGAWHIAGPEAVSRYTLGLLLARRHGLAAEFSGVPSAEHPEPRPRDLRLSTARADAALRIRPRPVSDYLAR